LLVSLRIENLAVIEEVTIPFHPGFNVLTGETGVGKSMVVTALGLLAGGRASSVLLRTGQREGIIEATFSWGGKEVVLKRVIGKTGRSKAYIDGKAVPLTELVFLGRRLLDIYGQDQHFLLRDPQSHLEFLDQWAGLWEKRQQYRLAFEAYRDLQRELRDLYGKRTEAKRRREFLLYEIRELEEANLDPEEEERLKERRGLLLQYHKVLETLSSLKDFLDGALKGVSEGLRELAKVEGLDRTFEGWSKSLAEAEVLLQDLSFEVEKYCSELDHDPMELDRIESRLYSLQRLKDKYGVADLRELVGVLRSLRDELEALEGLQERIRKLEEKQRELLQQLRARAEELTRGRLEAAERLSERMQEALRELGMPHVTFTFSFQEPQGEGIQLEGMQLGPFGAEEGEFFFSANPGEEPRPLSAIASGGELSRTMLALRELSLGEETKVLIFDEIDAGIGGITAQIVGRRLQGLAKRHQLLCVTHLPQIAARAHHHLRVRKEVVGGRTRVKVEVVKGEERKWEIARMLAGDSITETTLRQAEELLEE